MPSTPPTIILILGLVLIAQQFPPVEADDFINSTEQTHTSSSPEIQQQQVDTNTTTNVTMATGDNVTMTTTNSAMLPAAESFTVPANSTDFTDGVNTTTTTSFSTRPVSTSPSPTNTHRPSSPKPMIPDSPASTTKKIVPVVPKPTEKPQSGEKIAAILIVVILLAVIVLGGACFFTRKRSRRFSVDLHSRQDDTHIPLSTVDPEGPADSTQNGMQTFDRAQTVAVETKDPAAEANDKGEPEEKVEADKSAADTSADPPAPAPSPASSEGAPAQEPTPTAAAAAAEEQSPGEKTDDEGAVSNKTSVESLKDPTNVNNSNNSAAWTGAAASGLNLVTFTEVPLNSPV